MSCVNAEKKVLNPTQVALTKIPRNEAKIYQKMDFLDSEGYLLTSPGCCGVLLGNDLSNVLAVSVLSQKYNDCTFHLQK